MDERDWSILLTLYEEKNITRAAKKLFISQSSLTSRIHDIEARFGVKVVVRSKQGVTFTEEGEYLVQCAREMIEKLRSIEQTIQGFGTDVKGTIQLATTGLFTKHELPLIIKGFFELYPNVEFKVRTGLSEHILSVVSEDSSDVGFVRGDYDWKYDKKLLIEEPMYIVSKEPISLENIISLPRVAYKGSNSMITTLNQWWKENYDVAPIISVEVDKVEACKELVLNGLGYAFLPDSLIQGEEFECIPMIQADGKPLLRRTWMMYKSSQIKSAATRTFIEFMLSYYHH